MQMKEVAERAARLKQCELQPEEPQTVEKPPARLKVEGGSPLGLLMRDHSTLLVASSIHSILSSVMISCA